MHIRKRLIEANILRGLSAPLAGLGSTPRGTGVKMLLSLGADPKEATAVFFADAVRAGIIPSINSMMGVGVVFLPGMMTGQILAGADPVLAIKYQIVVKLMLVGSTSLGSVLAVHLARRRLFTSAAQLVPEFDAERS